MGGRCLGFYALIVGGVHAHFGAEGGGDVDALGNQVDALSDDALKLNIISCKGLKVWPEADVSPSYSDAFRCRFKAVKDTVTQQDIAALIRRAAEADLDMLQAIHLFSFDGKDGFTKSQGE